MTSYFSRICLINCFHISPLCYFILLALNCPQAADKFPPISFLMVTFILFDLSISQNSFILKSLLLFILKFSVSLYGIKLTYTSLPFKRQDNSLAHLSLSLIPANIIYSIVTLLLVLSI